MIAPARLGRAWRCRMLVGWALLIILVVACENPRPGGDAAAQASACPKCTCAPKLIVDTALLAFLSKAKVAHHQADLALADKAADRAILALEALVDGPVPGKGSPPAEAREVMADSLARLAELKSAANRLTEAESDVRRGLKLLTDRNMFRGRLMEMLGVVEERRFRKLVAEGQEEAAAQAKQRAVDAFAAAVAIQDEVIRRVLAEPEGAR